MSSSKQSKKQNKGNKTARRFKIPKSFHQALKKSKNRTKRSSSGSNECPICYERMEQRNIAILPCGHKFHFSCIFKATSENMKCPLCRSHVLLTALPRVTIMANDTERTLHHDPHTGSLYEPDGTQLEFTYEILPEVFTITRDETPR